MTKVVGRTDLRWRRSNRILWRPNDIGLHQDIASERNWRYKGCNRIEIISETRGSLKNLGGVWKNFKGSIFKMDKPSCGSLEKEIMQTWKSDLLVKILYLQIGMSNKCFESENIFVCTCKTFFVAADLYISLPSQRKHFSSAEKQIAKVQPVCDLNIFPSPR